MAQNQKITATQLNYLKWLLAGNHISICLELCSKLGEFSYTSPLPFKADARAIFNLYREGMITTFDEFEYGIRWLVVAITPKGIKALEQSND